MGEATSTLADPGRRQEPGSYRYEAHVRRDFAADELARKQRERSAKYGKDFDLSSDSWWVEKVYND